MKMSKFNITFESTLDVVVYAPEGTSEELIQELAGDIARNPSASGWDFPDYEANVWVGSKDEANNNTVDIPDAECKFKDPLPGKKWRNVVEGRLRREDVVVLSDDRTHLVCVTDATWWEVKEPKCPHETE